MDSLCTLSIVSSEAKKLSLLMKPNSSLISLLLPMLSGVLSKKPWPKCHVTKLSPMPCHKASKELLVTFADFVPLGPPLPFAVVHRLLSVNNSWRYTLLFKWLVWFLLPVWALTDTPKEKEGSNEDKDRNQENGKSQENKAKGWFFKKIHRSIKS